MLLSIQIFVTEQEFLTSAYTSIVFFSFVTFNEQTKHFIKAYHSLHWRRKRIFFFWDLKNGVIVQNLPEETPADASSG